MAQRPIFRPAEAEQGWVTTQDVEFDWHPGFAVSQKQKSIASLHEQAKLVVGCRKLLEISTKSTRELGERLSAFNLGLTLPTSSRRFPLEVVFQSSKVFQQGGPFMDLLSVHPRDAKRDERLRSSGALIAFELNGHRWPLQPQTLFYDWLYLKAVNASGLGEQLLEFDGFTDIEFNPAKSINCQARSAALYVALAQAGELEAALNDEAYFTELSQPAPLQQGEQGALF